MKFRFVARCGEETLPLEVNLDYRPGKQGQRARRVAVGELLALLALDRATIDATGEDMVKISTDKGIWIIAEGRAVTERRGGP